MEGGIIIILSSYEQEIFTLEQYFLRYDCYIPNHINGHSMKEFEYIVNDFRNRGMNMKASVDNDREV
jgi:hypothetical protein